MQATAEHMRGLTDKATRVRVAQARAKRHIAEAPTTAESRERAAQALIDAPPYVDRMLVKELLDACRWIGEHRSLRLLAHQGIDPSMTVGRLDLPARNRLALILEGQFEQMELGA